MALTPIRVGSDAPGLSRNKGGENSNIPSSACSITSEVPGEGPPEEDSIETHFQNALEVVTHGAIVSIPAIVLKKGLVLAFTAVLTNGFAPGTYGLFALAYRLHAYLVELAGGFEEGLTRFLPTVESSEEQDVVVTIAATLITSTAILFGIGLFFAAPFVTDLSGYGPQFRLFVRVFAIGVPVSGIFITLRGILRGLEEVGALNLMIQVAFPTGQLLVGIIGALVFHDLALVAGGVILVTMLISAAVSTWLIWKRGIILRLRDGEFARHSWRYVRFTAPLFGGRFAKTIQTYGFYLLIIVFLHGVAGGVFVVGVLVGTFVHLPLLGVNQFIRPVAAVLQEQNNHEDLRILYQVTSRLVILAATALAIPVIVYRADVMGLFGQSYVPYAPLLPLFVLAHYSACTAGSVGGILWMTDHPRAFMGVNGVTTVFVLMMAIPMTMVYGLGGMVVSYLSMRVVNNALEMGALYYLEGLQPFTRLHVNRSVAVIPLGVVTFAARVTLPPGIAPIIGTLFGLVAYAGTLRWLGFTPIESKLATSIIDRYMTTIPTITSVRTPTPIELTRGTYLVAFSMLPIAGGFVYAVTSRHQLTSGVVGLISLLGGILLLVWVVLEDDRHH